MLPRIVFLCLFLLTQLGFAETGAAKPDNNETSASPIFFRVTLAELDPRGVRDIGLRQTMSPQHHPNCRGCSGLLSQVQLLELQGTASILEVERGPDEIQLKRHPVTINFRNKSTLIIRHSNEFVEVPVTSDNGFAVGLCLQKPGENRSVWIFVEG